MGPLEGLRVLEFAGLGAAPFAAMALADMGADVTRVDRITPQESVVRTDARLDLLNRGRRSVAIDLKVQAGISVVHHFIAGADVVLEGWRPGVAERLGIGPDECHQLNRRLIYGRVTGWGRDGPYASMAGHDLNYIGLAGVLEPIGTAGGPPAVPLNLLGDFAGGGLSLAFGVVCALHETSRSGIGQVVDAAMIDGAALLNTMLYGSIAQEMWPGPRGTNIIDGGSHFMNVYRCSDGNYVSVAAAEPRFYAELLARLGLNPTGLPNQTDRSQWPAMKQRLAAIFATRDRSAWSELFAGTDGCVAPVLSPREAPMHPHNQYRETFINVDGVTQPAPTPRFDRTPARIRRGPAVPGEHTHELLAERGYSEAAIAALVAAGTVLDGQRRSG